MGHQAILEHIPVMVWLTDTAGHCVWINEVITKYTGLSTQELMGKNWLNALHPDDRERTFNVHRNAFQSRNHFEAEFRVRRHDGEYRWVQDWGHPHYENGEFVGFIGSGIDIHERYLFREGLKKNEEMLRKMFEDAAVGMAQIDIDGRFLRLNRKLGAMLGYKAEEMIGHRIQDFTHPDDLLRTDQARMDLFQGKIPFFEDEKRYIHKEGHLITAIVRTSPIKNWSGHVVAAGSQMIDITSKVEFERALREANTQFRLALSARQMGVWSWNCVTDRIEWDETTYLLYGFDKSRKIFFKDWQEAIFPEDREQLLGRMEEAQKDAKKNEMQASFRIQWPDGQIRHVKSCWIIERSSSGLALRYVGLNWDITEEIAHQAAIDHQRSVSTNVAKMAALGEMAAGMAHEINNPLAIIMGKVQQIEDMFNDGKVDKDKAIEHCTRLQNTVNRIATIIRGLRSFARDDRRDPMTLAAVDDMVRDTLSFCQAKFRNHGVELQLAEPFPTVRFECHPGQISQILLNLLNNAFDAVQSVEKKQIRLEVVIENAELIFRVTDSGTGVDRATAEKIFQPFYTTKPAGKGIGLGLSISKGLVENHGGKLVLVSPGAPTIFEVRLPHRRGLEKVA